MKFLRFFVKVFRSYQYSDWLITGLGVAMILLMFVKMMIFPYGFFSFGESNIYTEGIISKNGIQNINPLFVDYNDADREVSRLVFSGLMQYDPDKKAVVDDMATLTIDETKTQYTFILRDGLKWSDGKPLTIDDVYYTFHDVILSDTFSNEILKKNFAGVEVEKVNSNTIKFTLDKPNVFFITNFTIGLLPQHIWKDVDPSDLLMHEFNKQPAGSGPYMVTDPVEVFSDGRTQVTVERNPNYYGPVSEIENVRFISYPTMDELFEARYLVDGVVKISGKYVFDFQNSKRFELVPYELPQYVAVFMNMDGVVLNNKSVRVALNKALDKQVLVNLLSYKVLIDTPLFELNQGDIAPADVQGAKEDLYGAGYKTKEEDTEKKGLRYDKDDKPLTLDLIVRKYEDGSDQQEEMIKLTDFLKVSWREIGVDLKIEFLEQEDFKGRMIERGYDLLIVGQNLGYNLDTYSYWHSTQSSPDGQNFSNYKSFQVDTLIENIRSNFDLEKRTQDLKQLDTQIKGDVPAIFLYRPIYYYASDGKVSGMFMDGVVFPNDRFARIKNWKFER